MAFLCNVGVQATTLAYKDLDSLAAESEGIVVGTVSKIESNYGYDNDIYTFVTLENLVPVKGSYPQQDFVLQLKGGQIGNDVLDVEGSPHFEPNERVVLFIHGNGRELVPLVGWTQGVFRVGVDQASGQEIVLDHDGNRVLGVAGKRLIKERKLAPQVRILGEEIESVTSRQVKGNAGTSDDGSAPTLSSDRVKAATAPSEPLGLAQFLNSVKERVTRTTRNAPSARAAKTVESMDYLPDQVNQNDEPPAGGQLQGLDADSVPETNELSLPKPMSTKDGN